MDESLPRALLDAVRNRTLIPFVGAGVSMAVLRSDGTRAFPSWHGLLEAAARRLQDEARSDVAKVVDAMLGMNPVGYLEVAKHAKKGLGALWPRFLTDTFGISREHVRDDSLALARAVWSLGSPLVVTTNYDRVLDWACPRSHDLNRWAVESKTGLADYLAGRLEHPALWQLHGSINEPGSIILSPDGYQRLYSDDAQQRQYEAALHSLRSLMLSKTLLFVGFSLDDPFIERQLAWVQETFETGGPHYVLTRDADLAAMRGKLVNARADIQPIAFGDFGAPLLAKLGEIARAGRPPFEQAPESAVRGYLVWEDLGELRNPAHLTHLLTESDGQLQVTPARRRGLFAASRNAFWELRWSNRELINQPVPSMGDRKSHSETKLAPEVIPLTDAHFISTRNETVGLGGDWDPFYWHNEGVDAISREFMILGSVGPMFFVRSEDFIMYQDAMSCFYDSGFDIVDLEQQRVSRLSEFFDETERARVDTVEGSIADHQFRADPEYDPTYRGETGRDPGLTMVEPEHDTDGLLQLTYQFTREACRAASDGCWSVYTVSQHVTSDFLPTALEPYRRLPAPVLQWLRARERPPERWGWSEVHDVHITWCRALFGDEAVSR